MSTDAPLRAEGSRDELAAQLDKKAEGWWHLGKDKLSDASRAAAEALRQGEQSVRVGPRVYVVTET